MSRFLGFIPFLVAGVALASEQSVNDPALTKELHHHGWIAFSAQTGKGDWDLFVMRPDGSEKRALTTTPEINEAAPRFSPDGKRLLFYRMPVGDAVDNNTYGTKTLVIANANGTAAVEYGADFQWASWGPDSTQIAALTAGGMQVIDLATRNVVRSVPRKGIVQQVSWSPDGKAWVGTANGLGQFWNIGALTSEGAIVAVSATDRYNCTPDWTFDGKGVIYAHGIIPDKGGRAQLWRATPDGKERHLVVAEEGRHLYGACDCPDGKYLLFTRSVEDLGAVGKSQTTMAIVRWADTPMVLDVSASLQQQFPAAKPAQYCDLGPGWEPHWTLSEAPAVVK
jgi:Tol biopolymer transport system component